MFGNESVSLVHARDQTRPVQSIPTSTQCTSAGICDVSAPRKRKRESNIEESLAGSVLVRPHPSSAPSSPQSLKPILILPRSHLPLSYLDIVAGSTTVPAARLFTAHIRALEPESNGENPVILISRNEANRSLYAVEWVSKGIYAMCKLGSWVKEKALVGAAMSAREEPQPAIVNQDTGDNGSPWWRFARADIPPLPTFEPRGEGASGNDAAGVFFSMKPWKPKATLETPHLSDPESCLREGQSTISMIVQSPEPIEDIATAGQSTQEIFDTVRVQYLETLYISRTSLAYFPKGPLSRLRAAFNASQNNPTRQTDLITFLRSLVLSLSLIDKKYKDSVPGFVRSLPASNFSEDDVDATTVKGKKKRKSKMKPGKGGLYPGEDEYLRKWWMDGDSDPGVNPSGETESNVEQIKRRVANLRTRETELQIILILEIFALQESFHSKGRHEEQTKDNVGISQGSRGKNKKWGSYKDLALVLDLLVDRLCIWQSVSSGNAGVLQMDGFGNPKAPGQNGGNTGSSGTKALGVGQNNDHLRDFCNEVVMPFYAARLPEHCNIVSRKLGGPTSSSSFRSPLAKISGPTKTSSRPGDAIKRIAPSRPRQTLKRALTDEKKARSVSHGPSVPPTLVRSATSPAVPGLKRETSDSLLRTVPPKDSQPPMNVFRGGVLKSKRFSQREIDMSFTTNASNAKLQRKAKIEEELKEAITTLKKPNRGLAIKEFVETSERRVLAGGSCSKRMKKPIRGFLDVQVMATPKGKRKTNVGMTPPVYQNRPRLFEEFEPVPSPKEQCATQSGPQAYPSDEMSVSRPMARQALGLSVQDTPSRVRPVEGSADSRSAAGSITGFPVTLSYKCLASKAPYPDYKDLGSPLGNEPEKTINTMAENRGNQFTDFGSNAWAVADSGVHGAPLKSVEGNARARTEIGVKETPIKETRKAGMDDALSTGGGTSIYEALGWDEADDIV